jgi:hypothetical protein
MGRLGKGVKVLTGKRLAVDFNVMVFGVGLLTKATQAQQQQNQTNVHDDPLLYGKPFMAVTRR